MVPLNSQQCQRHCGHQKRYHGNVIGVDELTKEAAKSASWKGALDWNEMHCREQQGGYVSSGHVDKEVVGGCSHAAENFDHNNDKRVTDESDDYNNPYERQTYMSLSLGWMAFSEIQSANTRSVVEVRHNYIFSFHTSKQISIFCLKKVGAKETI